MARRILALLLLAMAAGQVSDVTGFVDAVERYQFGGRGPAWVFAGSVLIAEGVSGVTLLSRSAGTRHIGASLAAIVAVAWTILAVQAFARGLALDNCGCFGVHLPQPLRWWVLLEDAEFVALAWWVRHRNEWGRSDGSNGFPPRLSAMHPWRNPCSTTPQPAPRAGSTADSS